VKVFIKRLGCPKNDVDGDIIASVLIKEGHEIVIQESAAEAVIVNTCGFILPAKEESIEAILQYEQLKKGRMIERLYVTGCLSQRYGRELFDQIKGVDGVFGLREAKSLAEAISNNTKRVFMVSDKVQSEIFHTAEIPRFITDDAPYAYLKIADGCNRFCSYCAIPYIRGPFRSRPLGSVVGEAEYLAENGKKEIILVSQEGTGYGRELGDGSNPIKLLEELEKIEGIDWIRLMYLHPDGVTDELIEYISNSKKTLGYFDIPLQHINDRVLKAMNRPINRKKIEGIISRIKKASEKNIIRTTFIVGFPGETEAEFEELLQFLSDYRLDRVGAFQYSPEEGTAAEDLLDMVSEDVAAERLDRLMSLQQEFAFEKNISLIGSIEQVIIDGVDDSGPARGRTKGDCPEIDQIVYVKGTDLRRGDIIDAKISMADGYDLIAESESR